MEAEFKGVILGSDHKVTYGSLPSRPLGPEEVLVKVHSSVINPSDQLFLVGVYPTSKPKPCIAGFEGSGLVVAHGSGPIASSLKDARVAFCDQGTEYGAWAEYFIVSSSKAIPIPGDLTYEEACASFVNPMTVVAMIHECELKGYKTIVHTAAASSLGKQLVAATKKANIDLIAVVRKDEQAEVLTKLGVAADHIINTGKAGYSTQLNEVFAKLKPQACFDAIAGPIGTEILKALPNHAVLYNYGALSGQGYEAGPKELIFENKTLKGFWLNNYFNDPALAGEIVGKALGMLAQRDLTLTIAAKYHFEKCHEALEFYSKNATIGKVLLQNPNF